MRIGLIAISAGGLVVLIGVALGSVLARIIFGRRGDRPRTEGTRKPTYPTARPHR
jgi:hypothetical protein